MTVVRAFAGAENYHPVECGKDARDALLSVYIPELEMTAIGFLPRLIKINEQVNAGIKCQAIIPARINMDFQKITRICLMATTVVGVCDETSNSTELFEKGNEFTAP